LTPPGARAKAKRQIDLFSQREQTTHMFFIERLSIRASQSGPNEDWKGV
jgi:hypothetical protein